ncbi:HAMP domain-containing histidine kinase [Paenibacillus whitsoniae]|uniref:histidine kinase n=1 Tax=Paenibacillus whitsoniae TaxID=2496558 RepID=A0A3S0C770_9BACL|nr:HAMP domain-containing histidine kinase [Paenibacillus whitsoniae]
MWKGWYLLLYSIIGSELQGLLYFMSAALLHLVLAPHFINQTLRLKLLFGTILLLFSLLYWNFAGSDPFVYSLQMLPVSIIMVSLTLGPLRTFMTWVALNAGCLYVLGDQFVPALLSSSFLLLCAVLLHKRLTKLSFPYKISYATCIMFIYQLLYAPFSAYLTSYASLYVQYTIIFAILSLWIMVALLESVHRYKVQREQLLELERNRMLVESTATISHEIRNSLTTTRGFLQLLAQPELTFEKKKYAEHAISGVEQAASLLEEFLTYAKPSTSLREQLDIREELESTVRFMMPYANDANVSIDISHEYDAPLYILGESQKLRQCLINLIKNAIESMPTGGTLSLRTLKYANTVQISIMDTGIGMSNKQLKSLGKPFYTTKENGTGLGLVIVMSIIRKMNGKISFSSSLNHGTNCSILFQLK